VSDDGACVGVDELEAAEAALSFRGHDGHVGANADIRRQGSKPSGVAAVHKARKRPRQTGGYAIPALSQRSMLAPLSPPKGHSSLPSLLPREGLSPTSPVARASTPQPPSSLTQLSVPLLPKHRKRSKVLSVTKAADSMLPVRDSVLQAMDETADVDPVHAGGQSVANTREAARSSRSHGANEVLVSAMGPRVPVVTPLARRYSMPESMEPSAGTGAESERPRLPTGALVKRKRWDKRRSSVGGTGTRVRRSASRSGAEFDALNRSRALNSHLHQAEIAGMYKEPKHDLHCLRLRIRRACDVTSLGSVGGRDFIDAAASREVQATDVARDVSSPLLHEICGADGTATQNSRVSTDDAKSSGAGTAKKKTPVMEIRVAIPRLATADVNQTPVAEVEMASSPSLVVSSLRQRSSLPPSLIESQIRRRSRRLLSRKPRRITPDEVIDLTQGIEGDDLTTVDDGALDKCKATGEVRGEVVTEGCVFPTSKEAAEMGTTDVVNCLVAHACGPVDLSYVDPPMLTPLTIPETDLVHALTMGKRPHEALATIPSAHITLRREDFKRLRGVRWLNDEIINSYVALINQRNVLYRERVAAATASAISKVGDDGGAGKTRQRPHTYVFNTYFYTRLMTCGYDFPGVARWTRRAKVDVTAQDLILIPVNLGNYHWVLTGIDMRNKCFLYLDSMQGRDSSGVVDSLKRWLCDEVADKRGSAQAAKLDVESWIVLTNQFFVWSSRGDSCADIVKSRVRASIPKQMDGGSCGVFTAKIADCLAIGSNVYFGHPHIKLIRSRMALDLYRRVLPG
jgi:Ulp1 protease family, C-terminal catalytic domain